MFDAVGTLLEPDPAAVPTYHAAGLRYGSRLSEDEVARRFAAAFARQEALDRDLYQNRTSELREKARWIAIVSEVFAEFDTAALFDDLWKHFAQPQHWRVEPDAAEVIAHLNRIGVPWAMASNFDERLRGIVAGRPELAGCREVFISSTVGWRKPAAEFFQHVGEALGQPPERLILVGDHPQNDQQGARMAGWQALLLRREAPHPDEHCLTDLRQLAERLPDEL